MASVKEILKNPMHREIERIKTKLSKEVLSLSWSDYRKIITRDMEKFFGPNWEKKVVALR
jgi:hypothetical protein